MSTHFIAAFWQRNKLIFKSALIGFLVLIMLIPSAFVHELIREREQRSHEVAGEISSKWAGSQTVSGPVLMIPYGPVRTAGQPYLYLLPARLDIRGNIATQLKHRSIYEVPVYSSQLQFSGWFQLKDTLGTEVPFQELRLQDAVLCFGIRDFRGIGANPQFTWNDSKQLFDSGLPENKLLKAGVSRPVTITADQLTAGELKYDITLSLKGSEQLKFLPLGSETNMHLEGDWSNPAFNGNYLPDTSQVSGGGFSAGWKVLQFNRSYPACFTAADISQVDASAFGLQLLQPVDGYAQTMRSVKYALLVIALTFFMCFFLEVYFRLGIHPLQYVLIGFALVIFYTLLLSLSEYIRFAAAYLTAAAATVLLLGWYLRSIFSRWKAVLLFSSILSALYGFIFILIRLEDFALLFGSIGLFLILAVVMRVSRNIWGRDAAPLTSDCVQEPL